MPSSPSEINEGPVSTFQHEEPFEKLYTAEPLVQHAESQYPSGWRLYLMILGLCVTLYLVNLEVTIVSTSSLAIANDLKSFSKIGWILTGYLITYTGFIIIWAKSSDLWGRKTCIIATLTVFIIFSAACGAAQNITQLIIFRAFQGVGAAGALALVLPICAEMVPIDKYPMIGAVMAVDIALANMSGPLVGGALGKPSDWRWVFLLNVPVGVVGIIILFIAIPTGFPNHHKSRLLETEKVNSTTFLSSFKRLDVPGAVLLLGGTLLLTTGLLEGGIQWEWSSATSISLLTISGILWIAFFGWEKIVTGEKWTQEPMFPWRFLHNPACMAVLLASLINGITYYILVICIPQRFETVNNQSPIQTGVKLLPFTLVAAFGSVIANLVVGTGRIAPIYVYWFFSALSIIGTGLLTTLSPDKEISKATYGYECLAGLGMGATWGLAVLLTPLVVEKRDLATANGALVEFRILGGAIGLAIMTATMENYLKSHLASVVDPDHLAALMKTTTVIRKLPPDTRETVMRVFADGYNLQMRITTAFAALQPLAIGLLWKKGQIQVNAKPQSNTENL